MSDQLPTTITADPPANRMGRPPVTDSIDLAEVTRLAALGMNQAMIAEGLGIGTTSWFKAKANNAEFAAAYKRGIHKARIQVLQRLHAAADKNFAVPMFMSKQPHLLGFSDQQPVAGIGGKLEIVVTHKVMGAEEQAPAIDITEQAKAIEGDS